MPEFKEYFLLDPSIVYLNHGSFGACPRPVFETYQEWQRKLERQPVEFLGRRFSALLDEARASLAAYLVTDEDGLVFFPNPTTALNMVIRNIPRLVEGASGRPLQAGDQVLSTDHEYGALDRAWKYTCEQHQLSYINRQLPVPLPEPGQLADEFWQGVTERTRLIFLSHITSPTALTLPVQEIALRARAAGILTVVDGAHAPGQVELDLGTLGADVYAGACHKWLMAPKGSGFLHVRPELHDLLDPLVISWGYKPEPGYGSGKPFSDRHEWQGTHDIAAFLSVSAAIEFQQEHHWESVRQECHELAVAARRGIEALTGLNSLCGEQAFNQMFAARLPDALSPADLQKRLYEVFRIEVPAFKWQGQNILRVSLQGYNSAEDIEFLLGSLKEEIS